MTIWEMIRNKLAKKSVRIGIVAIINIMALALILVPKNSSSEVNTDFTEAISAGSLSTNKGIYSEGMIHIDESLDDEKGEHVFVYGPYLSLARGSYMATINYKSTVDTYARTYSNKLAFNKFDKNHVDMPSSATSATITFDISEDIDDFEIQVLYKGTGSIDISSVQISSVDYDSARATWTIMPADLASNTGELVDGKYVISEGESNSVFTYGPYMRLLPGNYTLGINYKSDSDNSMNLYSSELRFTDFGNNSVELKADKTSEELSFYLDKEIYDFEVQTKYMGTGSFEINYLTLTREVTSESPLVTVISKTVTFAIFAALINGFLYMLYKRPEERTTYVMLLGLAAAVSLPAFTSLAYSGHDIGFHIRRIYGLAEGLSEGQFFIKLQDNWYNGYGYMVGAFYGDALLYIPAVFKLAGIPMETCYKLFLFLANLATVGVSYFSFKTIFGKKNGLIACVLYSLSIYRLMDIYLRFAVGEYTAMIFLPLFALAVYYLFKDEYIKSSIAFVVAFTGLINTHILSTEMAVIFLIIYFIIEIPRVFKKKRILTLFVSAILVLILNLSFIVPFIDLSLTGNIKVMDAARNDYLLEERGILIPQLFNILPQCEGSSMDAGAGISGEMPLTVGIGLVAALIVSVICLFINKKNSKNHYVFVALSVLSLFMSSVYFPWKYITDIDFLKNAVSSIQFPWRFLSIATLLVTMAFCEGISKIEVNKKTVVTVILALSVIPGLFFIYSSMEKMDITHYNYIKHVDKMATGDEYIITGTDTSLFDGNYVPGNAEITNYRKDGTTITFDFSSDVDSKVELPLANYKYYKCQIKDGLTGTIKTIPITNSSNNTIVVNLPDNTVGSIEVFYDVPLTWNISYIVTTLAWAFGAAFIVVKKIKNK